MATSTSSGAEVVVDSNYLIALVNPLDSLHRQAVMLSRKLQRSNGQAVISNYIFLETVTVLSQRVSRQEAVKTGTVLLADTTVRIIQISSTLHNDSWEIFQTIDKKNLSFVDCSTLAVLRHTGTESLLTFDTTDFGPLRKTYNFSFFG